VNASTLLSKAAEKRALFVGETIIDVYHYVRPLGRPLKESIVSVEHISTETFQGGVMAAAAHARNFCKEVEIFTGGSKIVKERWVEAAHVRKLFEVYTDPGPDPRADNELPKLDRLRPRHDEFVTTQGFTRAIPCRERANELRELRFQPCYQVQRR
jgi:hypothetical protein